MIYIANAETNGKRVDGIYIINHKNKKEFYWLDEKYHLNKNSSQEIRDVVFKERIK